MWIKDRTPLSFSSTILYCIHDVLDEAVCHVFSLSWCTEQRNGYNYTERLQRDMNLASQDTQTEGWLVCYNIYHPRTIRGVSSQDYPRSVIPGIKIKICLARKKPLFTSHSVSKYNFLLLSQRILDTAPWEVIKTIQWKEHSTCCIAVYTQLQHTSSPSLVSKRMNGCIHTRHTTSL